MKELKNWKKKLSVVLIVGLLLAAIPMTSLAEKGQQGAGRGTGSHRYLDRGRGSDDSERRRKYRGRHL